MVPHEEQNLEQVKLTENTDNDEAFFDKYHQKLANLGEKQSLNFLSKKESEIFLLVSKPFNL